MAELFTIAEAMGEKRASAIFVHGLSGDPLETWTSPPPGNAVWPKWLAKDIEGLAVYSIGYDAPVSDRDRATMHPADLANNVLNRLLVDPRFNEGEVILIGHSLGGLVIKLMLRRAEAEKNRRAEAASFIDRVRKVAFLATPHTGADLAGWGDLLRVLVRPSLAALSLVRNDANLRELNEGYRDLARYREIIHLILTERRPLIMRRKVFFGLISYRVNLGMIVKPDSGDPGLSSNPIPIPADHIEIAKPANRDSEIYQHIRSFIERRTERAVSPEEIKIDAVKDDTEAIRESVDRFTTDLSMSVAEQVVALLDKHEMEKAVEAGLERATIFQLARRIRPEVIGFEQAIKELENAVGIALDVIAKGERGSNQEAFVEDVLKRLGETTKTGDFDGGAKAVDEALAELDRRDEDRRAASRRSRETLLEAGVEQDLLRRDPIAVARRIAAIAGLDATDGNPVWSQKYRERFDAFYAEGGEKGINLSLEVAIEMARCMAASARRDDQRGTTLVLLGLALWQLGERESGTARLEEATAAYRNALKENTRERAPLDWAMTQMNLGNALARLGEREGRTSRLDEAVSAYRDALKEYTRERAPLQWAATQMNLGNALFRLGERESGTARLEEAVTAYREALKEWTRARVPLQWAATQMNLGNALRVLGERESGTARLEEAASAFREALKEQTRERVPLQWAATQMNLGNALQTLGERESGTGRLEEAVAAFREALKEYTRERVPLQWAMTQNNLGNALSRCLVPAFAGAD